MHPDRTDAPTIRRAGDSDSRDVFDWRNDETTRAVSGDQREVTWQEHTAWFVSTLANRNRYLYIAELADRSGPRRVAMCRFDYDSGSAEVSINLNPRFRGQGIAGPVLAAAIARFRVDLGAPVELNARIRHTNPASARLFEKCGFRRESSDAEFDYFVKSAP